MHDCYSVNMMAQEDEFLAFDRLFYAFHWLLEAFHFREPKVFLDHHEPKLLSPQLNEK